MNGEQLPPDKRPFHRLKLYLHFQFLLLNDFCQTNSLSVVSNYIYVFNSSYYFSSS
jgi:hypothetical protein